MKASIKLDRREFLGNVIWAVAGASVAAMIPFARADATASGDWNIDDMCGAYPPYAHPIPFPRAAHVEPEEYI
jgi:hypothetical protein